jgi:ABC-type sugar transport system substrate-binding protein
MTTRVVVSLFSDAQEYHVRQGEDAQATGVRLGLDVRVVFSEGNAVLQIQQLFAALRAPEKERPSVLVVSTQAPDGLERVARNAVQANVGWILLNRPATYVETLRQDHPSVLITSVTTDHREVGRIQGRQIRAVLPGGGGSVLYVQGPTEALSARQRLEGTREVLAGAHYDLRVLNGDWTEAGGERAIAAWLRLKTSELFVPDVVCCQNDLMALGARSALAAAHPEWATAPFLGVDGLPNGGQRLVAQGLLTSTVVIPSCSGPALEAAARFFRGGPPPPEVRVTPESFPPLERIPAKPPRPA